MNAHGVETDAAQRAFKGVVLHHEIGGQQRHIKRRSSSGLGRGLAARGSRDGQTTDANWRHQKIFTD